ncbi:ATP-binding protein [Halobium salinum]|uniref:histidine kinase n=1 Tax=Halobium salinum TaxID=1364940 RepID=A0ABD5P6S8_9EURY|nr:ATP-binding protein [Halobium salinum]
MSPRPKTAPVFVVGGADATPSARRVADGLRARDVSAGDVTVVDAADARDRLTDGSRRPACLIVTVPEAAETVAALGRLDAAVPLLAVTDAEGVADAFDAGATDVHTRSAGVDALASRVDRLVLEGSHAADSPRAGPADGESASGDSVDGDPPGANPARPVSSDRTGADGAHRRLEKERRLEAIHGFAHDVGDCETTDAVCWRTVEAAERILAFDVCYVGLVEDGYVVPRASTNEGGPVALDAAPVDQGVVGEALRTGESYVHGDITETETAEPAADSFASGLTVPFGDAGVFQAVSYERDDFTAADRDLAELLLSHAGEALRRIRFETELREERDRLGALFENLPEPVAACHADGGRAVVDDVNAAFERVFGYDRETVVGDDIDDFVLPEDEESITLDETYYVGNTVQTEVKRRTATGVREFRVTVIPVELGDFSAQGFVVYADQSGQKRREAELTRQNDRLAEFTSLVSHDLRNPLNVAKGHLDLAAADGDPDGDHLDTAANALDRMEALIADFLSLARQGRTVDETVAVDLADAARSAWRTVDTGEAASLDADAALPTVPADPERLRTVFENLFRNSVEHGSTCSRSETGNGVEHGDPGVTVAVAPLDGEHGFAVADDGPGIPPTDRARVFDYGFTTDREGTGFGLATVQRVVQAHGWSIDVEDRADGAEGSRFVVRFD